MLGYVKAFKPEMKIRDYELYRGIYCSLCRALGRNYSPIAQLFLSYDFALAAVLRLAVSMQGCEFAQKRCPYNPAKKCLICGRKDELDLCAHAVIITVFYKVIDNMRDAGFKSRLLAYLIYPVVYLMHKKAARLAPEIEKAVSKAMDEQKIAEEKAAVSIDEAAHPSANALGEVFSLGFEGDNKQLLYSIGYMTGRFVYILDAADDLESDLKNGSFNPFKNSDISNEEKRAEFANRVEGMLNLTQSTALESLDTLETKRFEEILENIIFDGLNNCGKRVLAKYRPQRDEEKTLKID